MRNIITPDTTASEPFMQDNSMKHNNESESISDVEAMKPDFESHVEKPKAAEKGAKLMQRIWGDSFLSDSLH